MSIRVEFFGVARQRAGRPFTVLPLTGPATLGSVIAELAAKFPQLAADCFSGDRLRPGYLANVDGERFVNDPAAPIDEHASLLIMSADAGG